MNNALNIVVLAKQVPDTRQVGKDAMTAEGTVNRAALPAIFNPEDLNALEMALSIKERVAGSQVYLLTMGPARAADIIREAMYRGADGGYLLSGREFAGSDTLATSYALACALRKINPDMVIAGRQAIDGDTAQVGPQVAEKLQLPQVTYAEEVVEIDTKRIVVRRRIESGVETVEAPLPLVLTVNGSAAPCRPRNAKRLMKYKAARTAAELAIEKNEVVVRRVEQLPELMITEWGAADIEPDANQLGFAGSPTKVWNAEDGAKLAEDIQKVYRMPGGKERYWDQVALEYCIKNYKVEVRPCTFDDIIEIDTYSDLKKLDNTYC
ncbi:MAG: electron transfer flavoprotein beta subunit/FixA family protein [Alistipes sp.]|nr:electron transfer flavoprotein beta subunit/FixA family protein [Alistipes sp.]